MADIKERTANRPMQGPTDRAGVVLPSSLARAAAHAAHLRGITVEEFVTGAVARQIEALGHDLLDDRARRADLEEFERIMNRQTPAPDDGDVL